MKTTHSIGKSNAVDNFVVYRPAEDAEHFVAHAIRTDQIGVGDTVEDAVFELLHALHTLIEENRADSAVEMWQRAPQEIVELFLTAQPLPAEVLERVQARFRSTATARQATWEIDEAHSLLSDPSHDSFWGSLTYEDIEAVGAT